MTETLNFTNISCPCCAEKLRRAAEKLSYVEAAELDFDAGRLILTLSGKGEPLADLRKIAKRLEPEAVISAEEKSDSGKSHHGIILLVQILLLAAAALLRAYGFEAAQIALLVLCFIWAAYPTARAAIASPSIDEKLLMLVAGTGAMIIGEYYEAVMVMLLNSAGEMLEGLASRRSRRSIEDALSVRADFACVVRDGKEQRLPPEAVNVDELFTVRAGERVALDGVIESGCASLDTSALTGESLPLSVCAGDEISAGCINLDGTLCIRALREYKDSAVSRIIRMTQEARKNKAKTESLVSRFAKIYTPCVMALSFLICLVPVLLGGSPTLWIYRGLTLLVVSCPCALVISVPMAYFAGMGGAAKNGIIIRGGSVIDALAQCNTFVFDKTGTLTGGVFDIAEIIPNNMTSDELLHYCAAAEAGSSHPLAKCLRAACPCDPPANAAELAGKGISACIDGKTVLCGSRRLLEEAGIPVTENAGGTAIYCAVDGVYAGCITMADRLRPQAREAVNSLRAEGISRFAVLSGDSPEAVKAAANAAGIEEFYANLLPEGKPEQLAKLAANGAKTAFVGDGINDAPVLSLASAGIAMGGIGSEAAVSAADIVIMNDDLSMLPKAVSQARRTRRIVGANIALALGIKAAVLILAATGLCGMWAAVVADTGVSLLAVMNSARLVSPKKAQKSIPSVE